MPPDRLVRLDARVPAPSDGMTLVVADGPHARAALRLLLRGEPGLAVVAEVGDAADVVPAVQAAEADVLLLDWHLRGRPGPAALLPLLRVLVPRPRVVALAHSPEDLAAARAAGVDAVVCKTDPPEDLLAVVRSLAARL